MLVSINFVAKTSYLKYIKMQYLINNIELEEKAAYDNNVSMRLNDVSILSTKKNNIFNVKPASLSNSPRRRKRAPTIEGMNSV
jgi:hypothetical protein